MTTKTDDIKLPPLPHADVTDPGRFGVTYSLATLAMYARAAVEADRQCRVLSDVEIEKTVKGLGARWDGSVWKVEDADLHPMVRALLYRYTTDPVAQEPLQITDAMVDAYLKAQADVIRKVDDMWGNGGKAAEYLHPVRESCRAGLQAVLRVAAPVAQEPTESVLVDGIAYTIPAPVAAELLRLNIELLQGASVAQEPVAVVDGDDEEMWATILPDRDVKLGQKLYAAPQPAGQKQKEVKE